MHTTYSQLVLVVDSNRLARDETVTMVRDWGYQVRSYESAEEFLRDRREAHGCLITEHGLTGMDGLALQKSLLDANDCTPVIVAASSPTVALAVRYMQQGAVTVLERPFNPTDLHRAVFQAFDHEARRRELGQRLSELRAAEGELTPQERLVMESVIVGKLNKSIATDLDVSVRTVEKIRARVLRKFNAENSTALAAKVTELQLLDDPAAPLGDAPVRRPRGPC